MTKKAILCVDDERIVLTSLRDQIIHNFGRDYLCELAESVEEAWEIIEELNSEEISILVIVSDWLMPDVKGDEFLIRVRERFPNVVTVLLTGQATEEAIERTKQHANLHDYISKPWDESRLVKTLRSGLEKIDE